MPRPVVPMAFAPCAFSRARSSATCEARIRGHAGLTRNRSNTGTPCPISICASLNRASSDSTTPLPIRQRTCSCRMPEGMSDRMVFLPSMTSVCPALWPPWKRTTAFTWSVNKSTTLPLPSSPHCRPITTRFLPITRHPQQCQSGHHTDQSAPTKLRWVGLRKLCHQPLRGGRIDEGKNAFEHQVKSEGAAQVAGEFSPTDIHCDFKVLQVVRVESAAC